MTTDAELLTPIQEHSLGDDAPDLNRPLTFSQFDPSLGTLLEVRLTIVGTLDSTVSAENLGPVATAGTVSLSGAVTLQAPSGLAMISAYPDLTTVLDLNAFDGTKDFAGASGATSSNIVTTDTSQAAFQLINDSVDRAALTGTNTVNLSLNSQVLGGESGSANLLTELQSMTGASVSLQYGYQATGSTGNPGGGGGTGSVITIAYSPGPFLFPPDGDVTTSTRTFTIPDATTDWTQQIAVPRFDPSLGTLYAINVGLAGDLTGSLAVENLGNTSLIATAQQAVEITVALPGTTTVSVEPYTSQQGFDLGAYDGTQDFAGNSGTVVQVAASSFDPTVTQSVTDAAALAAFMGTGTQALTIAATGTSAVNGSGNMLTQLTQQSGGTLSISYTYLPADLACFAAGTAIATPNGPVAVEDIRVGQHVSLASGGSAPVVWIGHRTVDCNRQPRPETVWPVRVLAGAFAANIPRRDLVLSPDHAVFFDGVLIPVRYLMNGRTIVQQHTDRIVYYHLELLRHALLLAEGLAAESFLDTGNRSAFGNAGPVIQAHPNFTSLTWEAAGCAPLVVSGPPVEVARAWLKARARVLRVSARRAA